MIAIATCSGAVGLLAVILLRFALKDPHAVLELVVFVLSVIGVAVPIILFLVTASIRLFVARVAYCDALTEKQIPSEAERGQWFSFRAAAADLGGVSVDPPGAKGTQAKAAGLLSFRHGPTGKWKLELVAGKDVRAAVRAFVQLLGQERVTVKMRLKKE